MIDMKFLAFGYRPFTNSTAKTRQPQHFIPVNVLYKSGKFTCSTFAHVLVCMIALLVGIFLSPAHLIFSTLAWIVVKPIPSLLFQSFSVFTPIFTHIFSNFFLAFSALAVEPILMLLPVATLILLLIIHFRFLLEIATL